MEYDYDPRKNELLYAQRDVTFPETAATHCWATVHGMASLIPTVLAALTVKKRR